MDGEGINMVNWDWEIMISLNYLKKYQIYLKSKSFHSKQQSINFLNGQQRITNYFQEEQKKKYLQYYY